MSYTTFYALSWDVPEGSEQDLAIREWIDADELRAEFEDLYPGGASGNSRSRDIDPDMLRLCRTFPEVLFTLYGSGEDETDLWAAYYRGGKVQHAPAEVYYPPFDPEKLAEPKD